MNADAHLNLDAIRTAELKLAMGGFATGVTIVATRHDGADHAMTCNSFNTVSLHPPMVLWSIRKESASRHAFVEGDGYSVSVLGAHQRDLAMHFTQGPPHRRFDDVTADRLETGRLKLSDTVAWFDCALEQVVDAGDHDVLIGRVLAFASTSKPPLLYVHGEFVGNAPASVAPLRAGQGS